MQKHCVDEELARLNRLRFNEDRIVSIDSMLADKRKKRIVMDFASLMDESQANPRIAIEHACCAGWIS